MRTQFIIVLVTTASKQEAETIVRSLLEQRLIACGNIVGPVASRFHWSGKIEQAEEFLVFMKSRRDLFSRIAEAVGELHSYEVPEVLALPVVAGSKAYLDWLGGVLTT